MNPYENLRRVQSGDQLDYSKLLDVENQEPIIPVICIDMARRAIAAVRMIGFANDEAITKTIETDMATFWSRSQNGL